MKALYGHTDQETSFLVLDYPYGFRLRCKIRYWLDKSESKGFRFVSQTENPKTMQWNKPKCSTYLKLAANMYLDEENHCVWTALSEYSEVEKIIEFVKNFPDSDFSTLLPYSKIKVKFLQALIDGKAWVEINGVREPNNGIEIEEWRADVKVWQEIVSQLGNKNVSNST